MCRKVESLRGQRDERSNAGYGWYLDSEKKTCTASGFSNGSRVFIIAVVFGRPTHAIVRIVLLESHMDNDCRLGKNVVSIVYTIRIEHATENVL